MNRGRDILLVHGAWHGSWAFHLLKPVLVDMGWTVRTVDLLSAGSASVDLHDDAEVVRKTLASSPGPTIVVGHSYGGMVISEAAAGAANLLGLVYLCSPVPEVGQSVWTKNTDTNRLSDWFEVDTVNGFVTAHNAEHVFYNDCPARLAAESAARLRPQSLKTFTTAVTGAAWKDAPSAYLVCEDDNCTPLAAQEASAARTTYVEHIVASHSPFLSRPVDVARFIDSASVRFAR